MNNSNKISYNDKLDMISQFFGVSFNCAKYMFHRRKKGVPFNKKDNTNYLHWNIIIQNLIVFSDLKNIDFKNIKFNIDIEQLKKYIDIDNISVKKIIRNKLSQGDLTNTKYKFHHRKNNILKISDDNQTDDNEGEWCVVTKKNKYKIFYFFIYK